MEAETTHPITTLIENFKSVPDFRKKQGLQFKLEELLAVSMLAFLSGAEDFTGIAEYCKEKEVFLSDFFSFKRPPSHDLFRWVFAYVKPEEFYSCFVDWTQVMTKLFPGEVIPIDGKALRATQEKDTKTSAIYLVSAWASQNGLVLGQVKVDKKSNEKTAIPKLLKLLDIKDCIVTIDAMGAHPPIAQAIVDKEADYLLSLKKNNKNFFLEVESFFQNFKDDKDLMADFAEEKVKAHGRIEHRKCFIFKGLEYLPDAANWPELKCLVCIESERQTPKKTTHEFRYYVSSLETSAKKILQATKQHWSIENNLHWRLDVTFNEDKSRTKFGNCPENLAITRKIALGILDANTVRLGGKNKRLKAGWNDHYLVKLIKSFVDSIKNK